MAKADYSRDYYADLELPPSADVNDIKKQFRKLALKYHPDRNPGKEAEVNAKFQTIQAAHEILTSPEQKSKYDTHRSRNAYRYTGGASGVRGNPWSDVSSHYPVPPRRPGQAPTSAARNTASSSSGPPPSSSGSSAHRYTNFNAPPSSKTSKEDLDSRYNAWKNMRPNAAKPRPGQSASAAYAAAGANTSRKTNANSSSSSSMPPPPPPHPPNPQTPMPARSASQRQKANASFGTSTRRPTGFYPQSPMVGDEPQAASTNNYFTNRAHNRGFFGEQPDQSSASGTAPSPAAAAGAANNEPRRASTTAAPEPTHGGDARNRSDESFFDSRQSTPYQTHGGEKFNPFDGVPAASDLNRTRSHRTVNPQAAAKPEFRRRSSSLPDESDNAAKATASARKRAAAGAGTTTAAAAAGAAAGFAAGMAAEAAAAANSPSTNSANTGVPRSGSRPRPGVSSRASRPATSSQMPQFEEQYQRMQGEQQQQQQQQQSNPFAASANAAQNDKNKPIFSNLSLDDDVFSVPSTPSDQERTNPFTRSSVEDINTRFVSGEKANAAWAFSAGGSEGEQQQKPNGDFSSRVRRSQSGSRLGRRSPGKSNSIPKPDGGSAYPTPPPPPPPPRPSQQQQQQQAASQSQDPSPVSSTIGVADGNSGKPNEANAAGAKNTETTTNYFNAGRWAEQIGSEHFVPSWNAQQPPNLPPRQPTPTQQRARPIKKPKPIQRSNTAAAREYIVITDSDEEEGGGGPTTEAGAKRHHHQQQQQQQQQQQPVEVEPDVSGFASPVAMDIDSPPAAEPPNFNGANTTDATRPVPGSSGTDTAGGAPLSSPDPQVNGARNIPVEPTRPEWRAGDVNKAATTSAAAAAGLAGLAGAAATASTVPKATPNINVNNNVGSEDSEEFRATLSDIHKVEPFAENTSGIQGNAGTGLGSFGDLQNNLPFESKAASASTSMPQAGGSSAARAARSRSRSSRKTITFPKAPVAPHPPPALGVPGLQPSASAWDKYVSEFRHYMLEWAAFNKRYVDHFQARCHDIEVQRRDGDFSWLTSADGDNDGINRYLDWMEQDEEVRARWSVACSGHDLEVRKFMAYRERMRQV